eukprot:3494187-Pyramimonas_sp.AAC.2
MSSPRRVPVQRCLSSPCLKNRNVGTCGHPFRRCEPSGRRRASIGRLRIDRATAASQLAQCLSAAID